LYEQLNPDALESATTINKAACPSFNGKLKVFHSALTIYYSPSDISGVGGMHQERIRATPKWRNSGAPHYDSVLVKKDSTMPGMRGLLVAQVLLFFSFTYRKITYPCTLVQWFQPIGSEPCPDTGMWIVKPEVDHRHHRIQLVIHLECILCAAHLIGIAGSHFIPPDLDYTKSLAAFKAFYVNKYANHHAHEVAF
jgi:hypothetical protein